MIARTNPIRNKLDGIELPWPWIGFFGVGQRPITAAQIEWLEHHGVTRSEYMDEVRRRESEKKR
jgi:hypothetical protein